MRFKLPRWFVTGDPDHEGEYVYVDGDGRIWHNDGSKEDTKLSESIRKNNPGEASHVA